MTDKIKSAFDEIKAEEEFKTSAKYFLYEKYNKAPEKNVRSIRRPVFAAVCALLVALSCVGVVFYSVPVSAISLDYDTSSVELGVNSFDKVVSVNCFGEADSVKHLKLKNMNYRDAVNLIMTDSDAAASSAVFSIHCKNSEKCAEISEQIRQCNFNNTSVDCNSQDHHSLSSEAHSHDISTGKYHAFLELKALDPNVTIDEIRNLSMKEIREKICALSPETELTQSSSESYNTTCPSSGHHGSGRQHGKHAN